MLTEKILRSPTLPVDRFIGGGDGLYLRVSKRGLRTWYYRSQAGGQKWVSIGRHPMMSLTEARLKVQEIHQMGLQSLRTVNTAFALYLPHLDRTYSTSVEIKRRFDTDILPKIGGKRLDLITKEDVGDLLFAIVERGSLVAANRTLADIKHFFDYAEARGWIKENPSTKLTRKMVGGKETSRDRNLSFTELEHFITELFVEERFELKTRLAFGLVLTTGQRPGEVLGFHARELQPYNWWHLPAERNKTRREHKIYLSPQARLLLRIAIRRFGEKPFADVNHRVLARGLTRLRWQNPFTPHDLRRTMATRMSDLGVMPHIVEKCLNHQMQGVIAVYNRAEYLPERRVAWRLWGARLAAIRRATRPPPATPDRLRRQPGDLRTQDDRRRLV